jgi:DNA-binding transcriptional MerR regulator
MQSIHELAMKTELHSDTMTIREMCVAFDVTPRALRFYETKQLLSPLRVGSRRLYSRRDRARLGLILRGKRFGFSLEDIRQTLDLYDRDGANSAQRRKACELGVKRLAEMEAQRVELDLAIAELRAELSDAEAKGLVPRRAA